MPSIFNHENNSCWGIKKQSCELFFSENNKVSTNLDNKLTVNGGVEAKTVSTPNYHVSSNAYYGYQRHVNTQSDDSFECAMDTIENTTPNVDSDIQMTEYNGTIELQYNGINLIKRKRNYQDISAIAFKRMRQEEPLNGILIPPVNHYHQNYIHTDYPRCQMEYANNYEEESESFKSRVTRTRRRRTLMKKEGDNEANCLLNLEELLKQTHGCDLYNFNTSYDI